MSEDTGKWFLDHWEGVIATIALIQPWIYFLWKKIFRQPDLEVFPSGNVEFGFSEFGPTIGIYGTLLAKHGDVFVKRMSLKLKNIRTKEEHQFIWLAFRSPSMVFLGKESPAPELPTGFIVSQAQPRQYNIVFNDSETQRKISPSLQKLTPLSDNEFNDLHFAKGTHGYQALVEKYRMKFLSDDIFVDTNDLLKKNCYWSSDHFEIEIIIDTYKNESNSLKILRVFLTEEQVKQLNLNAVVILDNIFRARSGEPAWNFNFVYAAFDENN